jgi:hypothetical protein
MDVRCALTLCLMARSWAADMAPGGLGSDGSASFDGTAPARDRARSVNPRSWLTNSSIERLTSPLGAVPGVACSSSRSMLRP